jgi:hypothetical protein
VRGRYRELAAFDAVVSAVSFEPPEQVTRFGRSLGLPFAALSDPQRAGYAAFGFARGASDKMWSWQTAGAYLRGLTRGELPRRPRGDLDQLGGDVVLDAAGRLVYRFRGETPAERPSVDDLLGALRTAARDRAAPDGEPGGG